MIHFFKKSPVVFAVHCPDPLNSPDLHKLVWLFGEAQHLGEGEINGTFVGPRKEMISPWSTNAVEITQNMGIQGILRIEEFIGTEEDSPEYDPMIQHLYQKLDQELFTIDIQPESIKYVKDIAGYNETEGLALSQEEIDYLENLSEKLGRELTDS